MSLVLALVVGVLCASGVVLLLERSLTRVMLGVALLGNGINVLILAMGGKAGRAPIIGGSDARPMSDPLPQVLILTSIVITFALTAFVLALAYRSWQLQGSDEVQDDIDDRLVAARRAAEEPSDAGADAEAEAEADAAAAAGETAERDAIAGDEPAPGTGTGAELPR
ncbi:Na(+) H(+) antiporter subunit C [Patulibacter medicamentivorans]|uniref:Na(+) H(+) antiporter subunit C n=1 Tax=Patulibacter medicamentivorans TaxID=1097667 RepID=H0E4P5_9ACTN|nr:Na(+)/H(+) antiporter subunit C [Patulibacter medicamentivorans]EHN11358.1 Na(+) H(+) antiporter subunit C [Patulibacter medicamentivorans]